MRRALVRVARGGGSGPLRAVGRRCNADEPAWAAEARRKYQEEQRRREARRRQVEEVELTAGNDFSLGEDVVLTDPSDALPVVEDDAWLLFQNHDSFPSDVAESWNPSKDDDTAGAVLRSVEEAKFHCEKHGYGGFVVKWSLIYFFKRVPPRRLVAAREHCKKEDKGMFDLYICPAYEGQPTLAGEIKMRYDAAVAAGEAPVKQDFAPGLDDDDDFDFDNFKGEGEGEGEGEEDGFDEALLDSQRAAADPAAAVQPEEPVQAVDTAASPAAAARPAVHPARRRAGTLEPQQAEAPETPAQSPLQERARAAQEAPQTKTQPPPSQSPSATPQSPPAKGQGDMLGAFANLKDKPVKASSAPPASQAPQTMAQSPPPQRPSSGQGDMLSAFANQMDKPVKASGAQEKPPAQQQQPQQPTPPADATPEVFAADTPIRCSRDITVKGVLAIRKGTEGYVVGPSTSGDPRRMHVRFERREDGRVPDLNVTLREVEKLE